MEKIGKNDDLNSTKKKKKKKKKTKKEATPIATRMSFVFVIPKEATKKNKIEQSCVFVILVKSCRKKVELVNFRMSRPSA